MKTVLIAEDDRILRARLTEYLKNFENVFNVIAVSNGKEAIAALKQQQVSLLVTDIQMPEVDGIELLAYVNKHHPVIFCFVMTAYGSPDLKKKLPRDILRFLEKPVDIKALAEIIQRVLERDMPRGNMSGISVVNFLHMVQLERKTCLLEVNQAGKPSAMMYFDKGELFDAIYGDLKGEDAALEIITSQTADISFKYAPDRDVPRAIKASLNQLIAKRLADEQKSGAKDTQISEDEWDNVISDVLE